MLATFSILSHSRNVAFGMLVDIANSSSWEQLDRRVKRFEASDAYKGNARLAHYFHTEWYPYASMWVAYFREAYHGGINTNNHQESMNHVWKDWLKKTTDGRLDSFLVVYFDKITLYYEDKYAMKTIDSIR